MTELTKIQNDLETLKRQLAALMDYFNIGETPARSQLSIRTEAKSKLTKRRKRINKGHGGAQNR